MRVPGSGERSVLFCAHLDTVPPLAPIDPVVRDGAWQNRNAGILGADNKAAVAALISLAERLAAQPASANVELLFTVSEEVSLAGAREFEVGVLRSRLGFTFDSAAPLGGFVVRSPTLYRVQAQLQGLAAHAGVRPEAGRSAILAAARAIAQMPLGRLDAQTSANIGTIAGGSAANVVPERCELLGEVRGMDARRAEQVASELVASLTDAANDPECECDLDATVELEFEGYSVRQSAPEAVLAARALRSLGHEPAPLASGGGSDANVLRAKGLSVLNISGGVQYSHTPHERIAVSDLEHTLDVALALVGLAGEPAAA